MENIGWSPALGSFWLLLVIWLGLPDMTTLHDTISALFANILLRRSLVLYTIWSSPQLSVPTRCCADQVNSEPHTGKDIGHSDDQVNIELYTDAALLPAP